jgi:Transcriptional regulators
MAEELDEIDRAIIQDLQIDGRRPFREIARSLSIAEGTVRARVKRLQASGVLNIVAFVDPMRLGHYRLSLLLVKIDPRERDSVVGTLTSRDEVSYLSSALGVTDLLVEFVAQDEHGRWDFVNGIVRSLPGVLSVEVISIVETHKILYRLPKSGTDS